MDDRMAHREIEVVAYVRIEVHDDNKSKILVLPGNIV